MLRSACSDARDRISRFYSYRLFFKRKCPTIVRRTTIERMQILDAAK